MFRGSATVEVPSPGLLTLQCVYKSSEACTSVDSGSAGQGRGLRFCRQGLLTLLARGACLEQ